MSCSSALAPVSVQTDEVATKKCEISFRNSFAIFLNSSVSYTNLSLEYAYFIHKVILSISIDSGSLIVTSFVTRFLASCEAYTRVAGLVVRLVNRQSC